MKTLKITFLLAAILILTLSGTSTDQVSNSEANVKQNSVDLNLLVHERKSTKLPVAGIIL